MRSAFVSVGAFALALSPLAIGTLPMTWPVGAWMPMHVLSAAPKASAEAIERGTATAMDNVLDDRQTANGERYDTEALTAAHSRLPFDTRVQLTRPQNAKSVTVRVNDRAPQLPIIDPSRRAVETLDVARDAGIVDVTLRIVGDPSNSH